MERISEIAIEARAKLVREKLALHSVKSPDMYEVLVKLSQKTKLSFRAALSAELSGDEAQIDDQSHTLIVQECVLNDARAGRNRARFTIAHELGHYFLGHEGIRRRNPDKSVYAGANERIQEGEADLFASYFLVPTNLAQQMASPEDISLAFQVSGRVAEIAFERIQNANRRASGVGRKSPNVVIDFLKEAARQGYKVKSNIYGVDPDDWKR